MTTSHLLSIRRHEKVAYCLGALIVIGGGLVLSIARLSGAVVASGTVVVESSSRKIQHLDGGIVTEVRVKNGDLVAAGDVLLKLDATDAIANLEISEAQLDEIRARKERLECESLGCSELLQPATETRAAVARIDSVWRGQAKLLDARRELRRNKKNQTLQRIEQLEQTGASIAALRNAQQKQSIIAERERSVIAPLEKRQLVPLSRSLSVEREGERLKGEVIRFEAELQRNAAQLAEARLQLAEIDQSNLSEVLGELREVGSKESELVEKVTALRARHDRAVVLAPSGGVVHNLTATTVKGVIKPGETVAEIVPQDENLVLEAHVEPNAVDRLASEQPTSVRFNGLDQRTTPALEGRISMIAPDAIQDQRNGQSYYIVRARLLPGEINRLNRQTLRPGMPAELHFNTGERTVLSYLMKPFYDQMARAMRER